MSLLIKNTFSFKELEKQKELEQDKKLARDAAKRFITIIKEYNMDYKDARPIILEAISKDTIMDSGFVQMVLKELDDYYSK